MKGWIRLHRQLSKNKLWLEEPFTKGQAWVDLVLNANHTDGSFFVRGQEIKLKRGQIGWSELTMADRWQWSRMKVRRYLKRLESDTQVRQQKLFKITTIITIINYNKYQSDTTDDTSNETTDETQTRMIKNDKELTAEQSSGPSSEGQSVIKNNMPFRDTSDDYLEGEVDYDGDGSLQKEKDETKEANEKVTSLLEWGEKIRGKKFLDRPTQRKMLHTLRTNKISPTVIKDTFTELLHSDYWKGQDRLPDFKTVVSTLKNKK